jgi:cytochrome c-type biogenesis protein CcmH/NrfF
MDMNYIIDKLVISFMKIRFISEKSELEINDENQSRITQIENIITNLKTIEEDMDKKNNKHDVEITKMVYCKKWNNLQHFHKMNKISEYLNEFIDNEIVQGKLYGEINNMLLEKKIKYNKHIVYNPLQQKITSLPILKHTEKEGYYLELK